MLSITNEIDDIKLELEDFEFYNYDIDSEFDEVLTACISKVEQENMIPVISSTLYEEIAIKDKDGLSADERNIYWAEVNFTRAEFLNMRSRKNRARQHVCNADELTDQSAAVAREFIAIANKNLALAGYQTGKRISRYGIVQDNQE